MTYCHALLVRTETVGAMDLRPVPQRPSQKAQPPLVCGRGQAFFYFITKLPIG